MSDAANSNGFEITVGENGRATFRSATVQFSRWRYNRPWEFYCIDDGAQGYWAENVRFVRFLSEEEGARLSLALETELARRRLAARGISPERKLTDLGWTYNPAMGRWLAPLAE